MEVSPVRPVVVIVGAGAAGALVALHACDAAVRAGQPLDLMLVDPAPEAGRGTAYGSRDPRHLLNTPVGAMSCRPDDPGHFRRWLCRHDEQVEDGDFVSRYRFGSYLGDTLGRAVIGARETVRVRRLRAEAVRCDWPDPAGRATLLLADGRLLHADRVVLATGPAEGGGWIPQELREAPGFLARPWETGALDAVAAGRDDVLLVGAGLTAVDLAMTLARPGRTVHAVSRTGLLPARHADVPLPPAPCPPGLTAERSPGRLRAAVARHLAGQRRESGDWRPAMDGLRPVVSRVWQGLREAEKAELMAHGMTRWNTLRHRMPPATARAVQQLEATGGLRRHSGRISSVRPLGTGRFATVLSDGTRLATGWVVDCTGPGSETDAAPGSLWRSLLDSGLAVPGPLGLGVATAEGRLLDEHGTASRALHTLGAPRRGELWETTAIPEIRVQAAALADALMRAYR
ncbi:hypothetical protein E4198_20130 [Streptomyces sp. RKND-216]|uniref:FAD/NAD(P)-binding protein n=1 Tax=Streptomyces sp. RKND-216 TaxID=2562581 RepID=UPI00109DACB9|nr:FAD/NAD(P)-binding protein [Streptomyces sp. RKND-216]THA26668.1 hypothetical protein E4198_20130 [Streptomyces sp. RKND-216]